MESTPFERLKRDFLKVQFEQWGTRASSIVAAVTTLLLLLLVYLFVDLMVYKGLVPKFAELSPARQREFVAEWSARPESDRNESIHRLTTNETMASRLAAGGELSPAPTVAEWELLWRSGIYLALKQRVGQAAADAYLPNAPTEPNAESPRLGILSLVARERNRWTGQFVGWIAGWNSWTWRPSSNGTPNLPYLTGLCILAFLLAALRGFVVAVQAYLAAAAKLDIVTRLRRAIYLHTYRLGSYSVRAVGTGEAEQLFTKQADAVGTGVHASLVSTYRYPLLVVGLLTLIMLVNFWLAVSFLMLAVLLWLIGGQLAAHFRQEGRRGNLQYESAVVLLVESLGLLRLVKCFQMERFNQNRVERQLAESNRAHWRKLRGQALSAPLLGSIALIAAVALLYLAGRSILGGESTVAGLAVMAVALALLGQPIAGWFDSRRKIQRGQEAADAIMEFLDRRGEAAEAADAEYLPALTTRLEFRHVTLKQPGSDKHLLENVSFAVPAGARVALVGHSLTEKRSLVCLIPRFMDPTSGEIRIEDKNIRWVTHESLRAQVALVMQDDLVFTDTVANNIGCGDPQYSLPQIIEAAKLAHAHQFIEKLSYGYETIIGEFGQSLRPGEQFRLALARALLRDPSILIIEEPAGTIDEDTLALLDDTLERAGHGRTIIFIANRLSTLRLVDRVFLLKNGYLEASGTHRDLWQNNEYYRRLQIVADATVEASAVKE